jgi:hypothetical protein
VSFMTAADTEKESNGVRCHDSNGCRGGQGEKGGVVKGWGACDDGIAEGWGACDDGIAEGWGACDDGIAEGWGACDAPPQRKLWARAALGLRSG